MPYTPINDAHTPPNAADAKYSDAYAPSLDVETARAVLHLKEKWQAEIRIRLREVEAERDVLVAQVERLRQALQNIDSDLEGRNFLEESSLRDTARSALNAEPITSLAHIKAQCQAEALEVAAEDDWSDQDMLLRAAELRRQAKGGER